MAELKKWWQGLQELEADIEEIHDLESQFPLSSIFVKYQKPKIFQQLQLGPLPDLECALILWRSILSGSANSIPHSLQTVSVTAFSRLKNFMISSQINPG